ncbi:MAG: 3-hydroxyacyl-CoA dehydrogenase/enoyl-CoA hydratase family protein [Planctomycetota bacterium]
MTLSIQGRPIRKIGVIGSGQIGPDIALYFTKIFHKFGVPVSVVDISEEALANGEKKTHRKIDKGIETGAFSPAMGQAMKDHCSFTTDYDSLRDADFIVEAATEDRNLKGKIFAQLEAMCAPETVFASNSSHLEPEVIFSGLENRGRTLVIHYFFPAERNPIVEIVPGKDTDPTLAASMMNFYEQIGKVPIQVGSRFGYAIDPIFEGMFHAAARLAEAGWGTSKEIDAVATRALGLGIGPFTAMNLTGGNPITHPALGVYAEQIMPWFKSTKMMDQALETGAAWEVPGRGEKIELEADREQKIGDALRGAYFGLVTGIVDSGISNVADLDMAVEMSLDLNPPFRFMNEVGVPESLRLVEEYAKNFDGFLVPNVLKQQAATGKPWDVSTVMREDHDGVAVLKIRRPKVLNALNNEAFDEIEAHFKAIAADDNIAGVVLTGFGVKAFVSGADVNFLAKIDSAAMGEQTSLGSQRSLNVVEAMTKPVVCAMNGFAFGGGNELAMACHARIARKGLKLLASQPEVNLGIIPGAGATQRLPRWIGVEKAAALLRTAGGMSSAQALEAGLISREVEGDLVGAGIAMVRDAISGKAPLQPITTAPLSVPDQLPDADLGHRSRAVDAILCRAILEGCQKPLAEGLAFEAKMFGEVCETKDMRLGVDNFLKNGPRTPAPFTHQ